MTEPRAFQEPRNADDRSEATAIHRIALHNDNGARVTGWRTNQLCYHARFKYEHKHEHEDHCTECEYDGPDEH